ncbi:DEAD/DEAH box helicase [Cylindrospermopsis raciborskii]|uniref:DEAD/DEAH box helicase n=1 Tax=Cylindrospermopsis raciborskii TaxID=77022 RepID=UPI0038798D48
MTDHRSSTKNKQADLLETYLKLSPAYQNILQVLSIIYEKIDKSSILPCLVSASLSDERNVPWNTRSLNRQIDSLAQQDLVVQGPKGIVECHPLIKEGVIRHAIETEIFEILVTAIEEKLPIRKAYIKGRRNFTNLHQCVREIRIGIYRGDTDFVYKQIDDYHHLKGEYESTKKLISYVSEEVCNNPFDPTWFVKLPPELYEIFMTNILFNSVLNLSNCQEVFSLLEEECENSGKHSSNHTYSILIEQFLLRACTEEAEESLKDMTDISIGQKNGFWGWLSFLQGKNDQAIQYYSDGLETQRKMIGKRQVYFNSITGLFFILALLKEGSPKSLSKAEEYANLLSQSSNFLSLIYKNLTVVLQVHQGNINAKKTLLQEANFASLKGKNSLELLFYSLCIYWLDIEVARKLLPKVLQKLYSSAVFAGYHWLAIEAANLLARIDPNSNYQIRAQTLQEYTNIQTIVDILQPQEEWEIRLQALAGMQKESQTINQSDTGTRLVWLVKFDSGKCSLQPKEQKNSVKGEWSKGRQIALKRLSTNLSELNYITLQDIKVCSCIEASNYRISYNKPEYQFNERAILALIGHPLVFWEDAPNIRVEIVQGEMEFLVKKDDQDNLTIELSPKITTDNITCIKETPTRIKVIEITPEHRRMGEILGYENKLTVPRIAEKKILAAINAVSGIVTVHSDIGENVEGIEELPAQTLPYVHLLPTNTGLKVSLLSHPFTEGGPYFHPGIGGERVIAEIGGKRLQTRRNLSQEKELSQHVIHNCPTLISVNEQGSEWVIEDPDNCLELLLELQALKDKIVVEWPQGEKMRVSYHADLKDFNLSIERQKDWFAATGELKLSEDLVLDMEQLLQLLEKTPGRFIPMGDGEFLALSEVFRKQLDELQLFSEKHGKKLMFHPLAASNLEEFVDNVGNLKADKHWKQHISRLKEVQSLQPELPSTFQAELRDYQMEGFCWLARLAHWGVGACLADQMGLGKTVQALAVITRNAHAGPTLIIAPTSVCMNWVVEANKFAPTLNVIQFGANTRVSDRTLSDKDLDGEETPVISSRQKLLDQLQPLDMLVCSYGLLQQDDVARMLSQVEWQTIVLDEAQAIKNLNTKRSQAAMGLKGNFKLITTGTPIENHLGELWNLFRFINPGLLGSFDSFNQRFSTPIEKHQDKQARNKLKKLIQPFLLRRTKSQVLQELPSRTEILLHVELSREEKVFYEALRRQAISKLNESDADPGKKHLQVLAEIMRLRRACCNPSLVMPNTDLSSSKLQLLGEVLAELLENHHKALVFSQFVDHLHIIRNYLESKSIKYQYLDGSTPMAERKRSVDSFQAGDGDIFLISLKAGGTGLNLTAADYVIHTDPWWNPAVEDQASDRAHRIGQQRPVTIYRLVAKDTIEDKIVELHHHKRDLADTLLEGTDMSGKISMEALLQLINDS